MALKKSTLWNGIPIEYHIIENHQSIKKQNQTVIGIAKYFNKASRDASVNNFVIYEYITIDGINYSISELYGKIKESKMVPTGEKVQTGTEEKEGFNGEIIEVPIYEDVMKESNWWADAENC